MVCTAAIAVGGSGDAARVEQPDRHPEHGREARPTPRSRGPQPEEQRCRKTADGRCRASRPEPGANQNAFQPPMQARITAATSAMKPAVGPIDVGGVGIDRPFQLVQSQRGQRRTVVAPLAAELVVSRQAVGERGPYARRAVAAVENPPQRLRQPRLIERRDVPVSVEREFTTVGRDAKQAQPGERRSYARRPENIGYCENGQCSWSSRCRRRTRQSATRKSVDDHTSTGHRDRSSSKCVPR